MASAEWGLFEWGAAEWGSIEGGEGPWAAQGNFAMNGSAALTLAAFMVAAGSFALTGSASLTTSITMLAVALFELKGSASLFQARFVTPLEECGHPMYAIEDWKNDN